MNEFVEFKNIEVITDIWKLKPDKIAGSLSIISCCGFINSLECIGIGQNINDFT